MTFPVTPNVHVKKDEDGIARHLAHLQAPYVASGAVPSAPRALADAYLHDVASIYGLPADWLATLGEEVQRTLRNEDTRLRFREIKRILNTTVVAFQQTHLGIPVWSAHLNVRMHGNPQRVTSSDSFVHPDVKVARPSKNARYLPGKRNAVALLRRIIERAGGKLRNVTTERLLIYRYDEAQRYDPEAGHQHPRPQTLGVAGVTNGNGASAPAHRVNGNGNGSSHGNGHGASARVASPDIPVLPLGKLPKAIADGAHYVVNEVLFTTALAPWKALHWRAFVEVETGAVLYLRAFVTHAFGNVFSADPLTLTGNATITPSSAAGTLDPLTAVVTLPGLTAPPAGDPQALSGEHVLIGELSTPTVGGPTAALPSGNFSFSSTTDNFAAVNTYFHCDALFRLMQDMGIDLAAYFPDTTFPLTVDHRDASLGTVNARAYGNATGDGAGGMGFNLADGASTVTISADPRVVWHEFGHELLFEHVGGPNFGFAHSPGDSLGAILHDPDSNAPDRFMTFPWIPILVDRRHDRAVADGWGWGGAQWDSQYNGEQVLSSTLFRLYRSTGGDSGNVDTRRFAARYIAYLIINACGLLTSTTTDAGVYATALMDADTGTPDFDGIAGGGVHKVVRWAFEKQGLYRPVGAPTTDEGDPPPIDLYIDDGRNGEYTYLGNFWNTTAIWNRLSSAASGSEADHETPVVGQTNYLYIRVKNRGTQASPDVRVRAYHCVPATGLVWPDDWQQSTTGELVLPGLAAGGDVIAGPFEWVPEVIGHECLLATVTTDGDRANTDPASLLPTAAGPIPHWRLVPFDNNIAQRNVAPVPGAGGAAGLRAAFEARRFTARNPYPRPTRIDLAPELPEFLTKRGWKMRFSNPGGASFTLGPRGSREVALQLEPGAEFTEADVKAAGKDAMIHVKTLMNGMLIGGMSYAIDTRLKAPPDELPRGGHDHDACNTEAGKLLDCLHLPHGKVRAVRVRRVTVDVDIEEDC